MLTVGDWSRALGCAGVDVVFKKYLEMVGAVIMCRNGSRG